jgi:hypothetical protein
MNITLFAQILQRIDRKSFDSLVNQHQSDKHCKGNDSWTHFVTMLFCQFSKSNGLREVCDGMKSATGNLNHLGLSKGMHKSSLGYCNANRGWELFRDFYFSLYDQLKPDGNSSRKLLPKRKIYILDSTTIDLCLEAYDWAKFRQRKGAIKLHTVLDFDGCLPVFVDMTDGKRHDVKAAQDIEFPQDSIVVADRAYIDFNWMRQLNEQGAFFVIRGRENIQFSLKERPLDKALLKNRNIQYDWECELQGSLSKQKYPGKIRMVQVWDQEKQMYIELLTNNFSWTASTISELYKRRWSIEQFFKEVKSHLKIKSFLGTTMNAVLIQIWTALITILLLKTLKNIAKYPWHLSNLIAFIRLNLFVKIELQKWLDKPFFDHDDKPPNEIQLSLF